MNQKFSGPSLLTIVSKEGNIQLQRALFVDRVSKIGPAGMLRAILDATVECEVLHSAAGINLSQEGSMT
jgi:hypothetical protein